VLRVFALFLILVAGLSAPVWAGQDDHRPAGIAWHNGTVDSAFARAKKEHRPVFMYWGAVWCPPCNRLKSTLFKRADLIERMRAFVPVYVDGDSPEAQGIGTRFKVSGYPTTVVFSPDGQEITRLPGEAAPERYLDALTIAMKATRSVRAALQRALASPNDLSDKEWRLLATYSWETDDQQLAGDRDPAKLLNTLANQCLRAHSRNKSPADPCDRLAMNSLALAALTTDKAEDAPPTSPAALAAYRRLLAEPARMRGNLDVVLDSPAAVVRYIRNSDAAAAAELAQAWARVLTTLAQDQSLDHLERLTALEGRIGLARIDDEHAPLPPELVADVRNAVASANATTQDANERQSLVGTAAGLLASIGLADEATALLRAELDRSHSPYYDMLALARIAEQNGDKAQALDWYARAHAAARGEATRLQWGTSHVRALIDLAPDDGEQIVKVSTAVLAEVSPKPSSFEGRNRVVLTRLAAKLSAWGKDSAHTADWQRIHQSWLALCAKLPKASPHRPFCLNPEASRS
jgi:thioredoxin-related protein